MIRFVIPAYNERENIPKLLADLAPVARELGARVIFVDDGSTDGTGRGDREHARDSCTSRSSATQVNRGLGTAINSGLRAALGESRTTTRSSRSRPTTPLTSRTCRGCSSGSSREPTSCSPPSTRPAGGSSASRAWRLAASKAVSNTFRYIGGLREIHTLSSLYRVYRAGTLRRAAETYGYLLVREPGFAANVELLLKLYNAGASVAEVPTVNDWSTPPGHLEDELRPTVLAYGRLMAAHLVGRIQPPPISPLGSEARCGPLERASRAQLHARRRACSSAMAPAMSRAEPSSYRRPSRRSRRTLTRAPTSASSAPASSAPSSRCASRRAGAEVTLLERAPTLGGLAGAIDFAGHRVDRFYHVIVPSDQRMIALTEELGLSDQLSFRPVGVGFFSRRRDAPLQRHRRLPALLAALPARACASGLVRPPVPAAPRLQGARAQPLEAWLTRHCGRQCRGAHLASLARLALQRSTTPSCPLPTSGRAPTACAPRATRASSGEAMGCLRGGHETLVLRDRRAARASSASTCALGAGVRRAVATEPARVTGVTRRRRDRATSISRSPRCSRRPAHLLPAELQPLLDAYPSATSAWSASILKLRRSLLPYYSVNICDPTPITTVVETSHVVGTEHTDGLRLAYLPKYCDPDAPEFSRGRRLDLRALHRDARRAGRRTSATRTSSTGPCSAHRSSSPSTRSATSRAPRLSGPESRASHSPPPARSTHVCSTASRSSGSPSASPAEALERLSVSSSTKPR